MNPAVAVRRYKDRLGKPGYIARADREGVHVLPWQQAATAGSSSKDPEFPSEDQGTPVPGMWVQQMKAVGPVRRREVRERYRVLCRRLWDEAVKTQAILGYPLFPKSVTDELKVIGWQEGKPFLWEHVEKLASHYLRKASVQQKAKDQRKVTLDWHGHYNT